VEDILMAHMIEAAKTGRASCRTCKQIIAKGDLRMGEEVPNQFAQGEMTYNWHHLPCAAKKKPSVLKQALESTDIDVPDKSELLSTIEASAKTEKPTTFPAAEHAPTGRASCVACGEKIEKGELRVGVESEGDGSPFMRRAPSYLHPQCAPGHTGEESDQLYSKVKVNSLNLSAADLELLQEKMNA
jgi:hypothetical protein